MTAVLYDEVVMTVPATPRLRLAPTPAPTKVSKGYHSRQAATGDPLVDGAARLLSVPLRHLYAALWRVGVIEVGA